MKLIIDIPDDYKKYLDIYERDSLFDKVLTSAIKNGIPLEEELNTIKAKIEYRKLLVLQALGGCGYYDGLCTSVEIIDKHIGELK